MQRARPKLLGVAPFVLTVNLSFGALIYTVSAIVLIFGLWIYYDVRDRKLIDAKRRRVGLLPEGRAPMREGTALHALEDGEAVGRVTSGGFSPSLGAPLAMGYVPIDLAAPDTCLFGAVRGRMLPVTVARMPFIETRYKRA